MTSTAIERRAENGRDVALFPGASAGEILAVAADVASQFSDVVKKQRMFTRIGGNDHIQIEAWQTIGALTGVLADEGAVEQLPWPLIEPLGDEPPFPEGREPRDKDSEKWKIWNEADKTRRAWELHRDLLRARGLGMAFGFKAAFRAAKNGLPAGWGEGRATRVEAGKTNQDDYALASMAQTRAQSRALGAPLKFVVKLAGYETTPAEEVDGVAPASSEQLEAAQAAAHAMSERIAALERELTAAHEALAKGPSGAARTYQDKQGGTHSWDDEATDEQMRQAADYIRGIAHPLDVKAEDFILAMGNYFGGVPETTVSMLRALTRFVGQSRAASGVGGDPPPENAPPPPEQSAYHQGHNPGNRYHGD